MGERHSPCRHQLRLLYSTNGVPPQTISGENLIPTAHRSIREREPLRPPATAIDGRAMAEAARGTTARAGTVIANVMLHHHAGQEITKKKRLSMYPLSFHGSLAHFRVRASSMVCCFIPIVSRLFLESSDHVAVGPVFRTDDLMQVFRGAVIPSVTGRSRSPPPAPRASECRYYFPDSLRYLTNSPSRWEATAGLWSLSGSGRSTTTVLTMSLNTAACGASCILFLYVYAHHYRRRLAKVKI